MRRRGFTLIELMIVVAIIAIIAGIAIPNLLEARISSNESACAANLRAYLNAQGTFYRQDRDGDGVREYASDLDQLHYMNGQALLLIDRSFAEADDDTSVQQDSGLGHGIARTGYLFRDLAGYSGGSNFLPDPGGNGYLDGFALWGYPYIFGRTGRASMVIGRDGTVYSKSIDPVASDADWSNSRYPDVTASNWLPITQ